LNKLTGVRLDIRRAVEYMQSVARQNGLTLPVTSGLRSTADQARLYANRATNPNPVAVPGTSKHERGLAVDLSVPPGYEKAFADLWQQLGGRAGYYFSRSDPVHFEG
jgi:LAS superfamily LD-carboxypeptidase LdcB